MAITADELTHWRDYETLTIEDGGFLLFGIEPGRFWFEQSKFDDQDAASGTWAYFTGRPNAKVPPLEWTPLPPWIPEFYDRGCVEDVGTCCEIIESAALGGLIDIAVKVDRGDGRLDWQKSLLKKQSFIKWVRERDPDLAAALSSHLTPSPDSSSVMASNLHTSKSPSEEARKAREAHNLRGERGCRRLILEHWDKIEMLHGPNADARQAKRVVEIHCTEDDPAPKLKSYQNQLGILRKKKLIPWS